MAPFDIPVPPAAGLEPRAPRRHRVLIGMVVVVAGILLASYLLLLPSQDFPTGQLIEIPADSSVGEMATLLKERGAIRSTFVFKAYARGTMQDRELASGLYVFERPLGVMALVHRMATGRHGIEPARVTFTEGMTIDDMAGLLSDEIPGFDTKAFETLASTSEGYLFPDTYFFMPSSTPDEIVTRLRERFDEQVETIAEEIESSGRTLEDIVIMASIIEREAQTPEDRRLVAGILWKRLDQDMQLQVDAPFGYLHGENGYTPTAADLVLDSPYNTYLNKGLPPTAIANPGLDALLAAALPTPSGYWYYLTGKDGKMYYGRTFEEHKRNRELYLD